MQEHLGGADERIFAQDWGIELVLPTPNISLRHVGIRMHDVRQGAAGENVFNCRIVEIIENPFSFVAMLRPDGADEDSSPIGWEVGRESWKGFHVGDAVAVSLPSESLLQLED